MYRIKGYYLITEPDSILCLASNAVNIFNISQYRKECIMTDCDSCIFFAYDQDYEDYFCQVNMDEDDVVRLMSDKNYNCPYFQLNDEYKIVRKQM